MARADPNGPLVDPRGGLGSYHRYNPRSRSWKTVGTVQTGATGRALFRLAQARTALKLRARWVGAADLTAAASKTVTVKAARR